MKITTLMLGLAMAAAFFQTSFAQTNSSAPTTGIENGKRLFLRNGCYECHGYAGQGGLAGVRLAQTKLSVAAFTAYVRNPAPGGMPPFRAKVVSDQELADVWAYIKTFPEPPPIKSIPILNQ